MALSGLSLEVRGGEILGLIGPNGSGKTTFFNVLTGLYPSTRGEILFGDASLTRARPQDVYRAGITRTFQRSTARAPSWGSSGIPRSTRAVETGPGRRPW